MMTSLICVADKYSIQFTGWRNGAISFLNCHGKVEFGSKQISLFILVAKRKWAWPLGYLWFLA